MYAVGISYQVIHPPGGQQTSASTREGLIATAAVESCSPIFDTSAVNNTHDESDMHLYTYIHIYTHTCKL